MSTSLALAVLSVLCFRAALVSALGEGDRCAHAPSLCDSPLSCEGSGTDRKCVKKKALGMVCGLDPFSICKDGLICDGICKNPVDRRGSCNSSTDGCRPPLSCVGRPGNKKCFMKKALGDTCGKDPFWVCQDGLTCVDFVCRETLVDEAGSCNLPGEVCSSPYSCIGNDGRKKCLKKKTLGMSCGEGPFSVCEKGLYCDGICKANVGKGESCNSRYETCNPSLKCEGPPGDKKCVIRRKGLGMMCNDDPLDPYWWCEEDLLCDDGVCKKPVGRGGECNDPDEVCISPFSCVGREGKKKCFTKRTQGETCPDPFWECEDKLICDEDKICKKPVGVKGKCNEESLQICGSPLVCDRTPKGMKCVKRRGEGQRCGADPFWLCAEGLECVRSICIAV